MDGISCPALRPPLRAALNDLRQRSGAFSNEFSQYLEQLDPSRRVSWVQSALAGTRDLFNAWTLEVLFAIAMTGPTRFGQLEAMLGIPAKTLSARLKALEGRGLLDRRLIDTRPPRAEYALSKEGRATAALASPLFTHLAYLAEPVEDQDQRR